MSGSSSTGRRRWVALIAAVAALALAVPALGMAPAGADTAPPDPTVPLTVSADSLPTVQINGVVWDQVIVGNTVYVAGQFTAARPAGAAAGTNETPRSNLLAYDITTGNLITTWAPTIDAQARTIAASADGTRIYVGGDFTTANGVTRNRAAAFDATTGDLITGFNPNVNSWVNDMYVSGSTLWMAGAFTVVKNQLRSYVASVSADTGVPTAFSADIDQESRAVVAPAGSGKIVLGGDFALVNGEAIKGLTALDATTGATLPFPTNQTIVNTGPNAGIYSLQTNGAQVFGTGYTFGTGGNFEGSFAADTATGNLQWVNGCRGDHYDGAVVGQVLYTVSHSHDCGAVNGHPQDNPWTYQRADATTTYAAPDGRVNLYGNFAGRPASQLLHWLPTVALGSYTGMEQGAWTVEGNSQYVILGGEFPRVNSVAQYGLARFPAKSIAPNKEGPQSYDELTPKVVPIGPGSVRISWKTAWDRDNIRLKYEVLRGPTQKTSVVLDTRTVDSTWWTRPEMAFTDTTAPAGSSQTYRVRVTDPMGNVVPSAGVTITVPDGTPTTTTYEAAVAADQPQRFWRLGEASGTAGYDRITGNDLTLAATAQRNVAGSALNESSAATTWDGTATVPATTGTAVRGTQTLTAEAWFKTTTTRGGKILGFGNSKTANSTTYDRQIYMANNGIVRWGVNPGTIKTVASRTALNDGQWHHVVGTLGPAGISLYVDGKLAGTDATATTAADFYGYWRVGGDQMNSWPSRPTANAFAGTIDDVAIYPTQLSQDQVRNHYLASGRPVNWPSVPADAYGAAVFNSQPDTFLRLDETSGSAAFDRMTGDAAATYTSATLGQAPSPGGPSGKSITLGSGSAPRVVATNAVVNPQIFTLETWFKTTTTVGGRIIGFGNSQGSTSTSYDRHLYMLNNGRLRYGIYSGVQNTIDSTKAYNDGQWHHVAVTNRPGVQVMYVDGVPVATGNGPSAQNYTGYWRLGSDSVWTGATSKNFAGSLDEAAIYPVELSQKTIAAHVTAAGVSVPNQAPTAAFSTSTQDLTGTFDASASTDGDGTIASYAWDFGDGTTGTGATVQHAFPATGTYTVTLTVTDDGGAATSLSKQVSVTAANILPVPSFTSASNGLTATFDASGSSDQDGSIVSYAWDFGDGSTATGATAQRTYAASGTYTVTLTVTDDRGGVASTSRPVTALAPNVLPTASFTGSAQGLVASFNAAGSTDPDGTIVGYAWDFGNGTQGTGVNPQVTYAAAGTYTVTLTVTDDRGGTSTADAQITVAPLAPDYATDTFSRTVAPGFGTADTGGTWTVSGTASNYSVANGVGRVVAPAGGTRLATLDGVQQTSTEVNATVSLDQAPTGGGTYVALVGRRVSAGNDYRVKLRLQAGGAVTAQLVRTVGGTETIIQNITTVSGLTYNTGDVLRVRLQVSGTGTTQLAAKVWKDGTNQPAAWLLSATDTTAALQAPGGVGAWLYVSASSTAVPMTLSLDDFVAGPLRQP